MKKQERRHRNTLEWTTLKLQGRDAPTKMAAFHFTAHNWTKLKKNAKKEFQKIREIVGLYLCMQRFHKSWMWSAGKRKRNLCKFTETCNEKLVKITLVELFFSGFLPFEITVQCKHAGAKVQLAPHCTALERTPAKQFPGQLSNEKKDARENGGFWLVKSTTTSFTTALL